MLRSILLPLGVAAALVAAGCGGDGDAGPTAEAPKIGIRGGDDGAAADLGFPAFATKNTTRVGGADSVAVAAGVARAVWPALDDEGRPDAVVLVDRDDWQAGVAASALVAAPVRAPVLLSDGGDLPDATAEALRALAPSGAKAAGNAQVIRVGDVARPSGLRSTDLPETSPAETARAIDALLSAGRRRSSDRVLIVSSERPEFAMPAAAWAAKSGDPVLFVEKDRVPPATLRALRTHGQPKIYVLGPSSVVGPKVTRRLRRIGTVRRVGGPDPISNAIAFARYVDGAFGWGVVDPGHGLVFANSDRPMDAAAAAPLAAAGKYGPLLLQEGTATLPPDLAGYLRDIQPGYQRDPVRGVYNHGWIIGDGDALPVEAQAEIDRLLEIRPIDANAP